MALVMAGGGGGGGDVTAPAPTVPTVTTGTVKIENSESSFPFGVVGGAQRRLAIPLGVIAYRIRLVNRASGLDIRPPIEVQRALGAATQIVVLQDVPQGTVLIVVEAINTAGELVATAVAEVSVQASVTTSPIPVRPKLPPLITSVTPDSGPLGGGTLLSIRGERFQGGVTVTVGGVPCTQVQFNNERTHIGCRTGAASTAGARDVVVTASAAGSATAAGAVLITDLNRDGNPDVVVACVGIAAAALLTGDGTGALTPAGQVTATGAFILDVAAGDFDRDGTVDLAIVSNTRVELFTGNGALGFSAAGAVGPLGSVVRAVTAADVNGDGALDLLIGESAAPGLSIAYATGPASFAAPAPLGLTTESALIVVGDHDGDGRLDALSLDTAAGTLALLQQT